MRWINISLSKRARLIVTGAVTAIVLTTTGVTWALLNSKTTVAANTFAGAGVNIGVVEKSDVDKEYSNALEHKGDGTGNVLSDFKAFTEDDRSQFKVVAIKNIDSAEYPTTDTYVRVRLVPAIVHDDTKDNRELVIASTTAAVDVSDKVTYKYGDEQGNISNWRYEERGTERYYYYTEPIAPGQITSALISQVSYAGELPAGTHLELRVLTEGVAVRQSGSLSAWGLVQGGAGDNYSYFANLKELKNM